MKPIQWSFRRIEKKYLMSADQYDRLRAALSERIIPDEYPESTICNLYYDTPDYLLIRRSMEKPLYKEKFRLRSYGVPTNDTPVFMESKKKFKGVVYKRRVRTSSQSATRYLRGGPEPEVNDTQIMKEINWFFHRYQLVPGMFLAYDRLAFKAVDQPELRITFDRNIRYRTDHMDMTYGDYGTYLLPEDQVLMEIKIPGAAPLWLSNILTDLGIFPASFSKYGRCYTKMLQEPTEKNKLEVTHCA